MILRDLPKTRTGPTDRTGSKQEVNRKLAGNGQEVIGNDLELVSTCSFTVN